MRGLALLVLCLCLVPLVLAKKIYVIRQDVNTTVVNGSQGVIEGVVGLDQYITVVNSTVVNVSANLTTFDARYLLNSGDSATGNYTFDTSTLHIDSTNDRVGIGTDSPSQLLEVFGGNLRVVGENIFTQFNFETYGSTQQSGMIVRRGRGTEASPEYPQEGDFLGQLSYRNYAHTAGATIRAKATENHSSSVSGNELQFLTIPNGSNVMEQRMTITNDGKVGIGTTSPEFPIEVRGTPGLGNAYLSLVGETSVAFQLKDSVTGNFVQINCAQCGNPGSRSFKFSFNGTGSQEFSVSDTGEAYVDGIAPKLGIGTSSPSNTLDVNGDANINDTFYVTNSGNVGIGITSPEAPLHISDGNSINSSLIFGTPYNLVTSQGDSGVYRIVGASNVAGQRPGFQFLRARGDLATPTAVQSGDDIGTLLGQIYDGTQHQNVGQISFVADGDASSGVAPVRISFKTSETNTAGSTERLVIKSHGGVDFKNQYFSAYDAAGGTSIGTSYTNITFDTEDREDALYTHATDSSIITINEAGDYKVTADCAMDVTGTSRYTAQWRLVLDGVEMPGSLAYSYHRISGNGADSMSITRLFTASSGSTITLQGLINAAGAGATTEANACRIMVERI